MPTPHDEIIFIASGALTNEKVISRHHSIIWFLGWRCIYAEIVNSRVENRTIDLERALKRAISILIGRLKAYGKKWREWVATSRYRTKSNAISRKHRRRGAHRGGRPFFTLITTLNYELKQLLRPHRSTNLGPTTSHKTALGRMSRASALGGRPARSKSARRG